MLQFPKTIGLPMLFAALVIGGTAHAQGSGPRLWIVDDGARTNHEVTLDTGVPVLDTSFPPAESARSSVAVDPYDGTLWGTSEKRAASPRGSVVNYDRRGTVIQVIPATLFGAFNVEGVAVDPDGSLWVVDDPAPANFPGQVPQVFHIDRDGKNYPDSPFPVTYFDADAASPQAIAYDSSDHTLWVTDNVTHMIYNVNKNGTLVSSFHRFTFEDVNTNLQGITVDESNWTLWVTGRKTGKIYNIDREGNLISSFLSTDYSTASLAPVGVAYDAMSVQTTLRNVITGLQATVDLLPQDVSGDDRRDKKNILSGIKQINKSFKAKYWQHSDSPNTDRIKRGRKVFIKNKRTLKKLTRVKNNNDNTNVLNAIDEVVDILRGIATRAYEKAVAAVEDACLLNALDAPCIDGGAKVAEAEQSLADAEFELTWNQDPEKAIDPNFKDAWLASQEAIQLANGP